MLYHSLKNDNNFISFEKAVLKGLCQDGSLYVPKYIPILDNKFIKDIITKELDIYKICMTVIKPYIGECIPDSYIDQIIRDTLSFPFPLKKIHDNVYVLELFHGPTLAFKDVGARFMAGCLSFFYKKIRKKITILVATSGDTGGAVAQGFYKKSGIEVIILYPYNGISSLQKKQITSLGENIFPLEIIGSFDDCQNIVKKSFTDREIQKKYILTSANSINIARWLPQMFYYFLAYKTIGKHDEKLIFSVPSGNFGNICAGMMSKEMGLPIKFFIASTNINDTIPRFLKYGEYKPLTVNRTISNAMDISNPNNFPRIWNFLCKENFYQLKSKLFSYRFTDKETLYTIEKVWNKHKYILDPHGAIGYLGIKRYLKEINSKFSSLKTIFLETAHPIKFLDNMPLSLRDEIKVPSTLKVFLKKGEIEKKVLSMSNDFTSFKNWLLGRV
ncbi:threonine synthase [Blattabacterium cuenoti]|uniref:threonine synthase n=1 Tax=Blattabacterium cuenoti TaxID=1653831 RepID=UPI00163C5FB7|nr:threonine synthase [Blattabacterium cuenoti]